MNTLIQQLQGRKTYLTCVMAGVLLFGSWQKWWQLPPEIYAGLAALATGFLRAGIAKIENPAGVPIPVTTTPAAPPAAPGGGKGAGAVGLFAVGAVVAATALAVSLGLAGCGSLDPAGVYQGDKTLYQADLALSSSYEVLHGFVQWEHDNRAALSATPQIKAAADQVRAGSAQWFASALAVRDAYQGNRNATNYAALDQALAVIHQAVLEALRYMSTNSAPPPPSPATIQTNRVLSTQPTTTNH